MTVEIELATLSGKFEGMQSALKDVAERMATREGQDAQANTIRDLAQALRDEATNRQKGDSELAQAQASALATMKAETDAAIKQLRDELAVEKARRQQLEDRAENRKWGAIATAGAAILGLIIGGLRFVGVTP